MAWVGLGGPVLPEVFVDGSGQHLPSLMSPGSAGWDALLIIYSLVSQLLY